MATSIINRLRIAAVTVFVILAPSAFADISHRIATLSNNWNVNDAVVLNSEGDGIHAATASMDELEFYLVGDYNGWVHYGDEAKFSVGDDGLWHKTLSLNTEQGIKVVNVNQRLFSATTSHNYSVTDEMIKAKTPIQLEEKGDANDDDDLTARPIIYLQNEATREFILDGDAMTLTVAGVPHDLTLNHVTQGTAHLSTNSARWGDEITISYEPMGGYSLKNIEVKCEDGSTVGVIDEVFEMPDQPVTVTVTFEETRSGQCGDNLIWWVNNDYDYLDIQGNGPMYDYEANNQPWLNYRDKITDISIGDGVETLGAYTFYGMSGLANSINLPNSVVSIGEGCFEYTNINVVKLPANITSIGKNAFHYTELSSINLEECTSDEFTALPEGVFRHTNLNSVTIPANITSLGDNSFADNVLLEDVTLLSSTMPQLGTNVFGGVRATLKIDNVDVYHAIRKAGSHWGNADEFTILPLDEKSFRYAVVEGIENGYVYTGEPLPLAPHLLLCDEVVSASNFDMKYYKDGNEVQQVVDAGTYRCEFTPTEESGYHDNISKTFIVSEGGLSYIDENGDEQILPDGLFTEFTDDLNVLGNGWYVVNSDVNVSSRIEVTDDGAKILLCDGYTLSADKGIHCSNKELTIYGQSGNTGRLIAAGNEANAGIGGDIHEAGPVLTINGGDLVVTSSGEHSAAAIGGGEQGYWGGTFGSNVSVTINGGKVGAYARGYGAGIGGGGDEVSGPNMQAGSGGVVVINGGQVDATSQNGYGIGPGRIKDHSERDGEMGSISLGWRKPTDAIEVSSVYGNLVFNNDFAIDRCYVKAVTENVNAKYYLTLLPANVIEIEEGIENGSVEMDYNACPIGEAKQFSVYVYPDQDYVLAEIKAYIKDANNPQGSEAHFAPSGNNEVALTKVGQHEYTFDMPDGSVRIEASFKEDSPTGIVDIDADTLKNGKRYNILGQPVDEQYKGVVIIDGKKLIVK